jgi:hypothetical protein
VPATAHLSKVAEIEQELARLRSEASGDGELPYLRTSVMTHLAWVPGEWLEAARSALEGLAERHPSRTILLVPAPDADEDAIDAAYRDKYGRYGGTYVDPMVSPDATAATLRLSPR